MSNNSEKEWTFWQFLTDSKDLEDSEIYGMEIPIIQRDYAQGRLGKEYLRQSFLADIRQALDGKLPDEGGKLKLDFIYGSVSKEKKLQPLDGQQRLTTLWLLHWYIALRAGKLDECNCSILGGFSYETRISSREFCANLCVPEHFKAFDGKNIVQFIKNSTWFYSALEQDPTIQSMLTMLGGTKISNKNNDDITDGLEELFVGRSKDDFDGYWENLISEDAPVVFYYQPLKGFGLSDDLYVKMNARGKQLTVFENLKADLIGYIREKAEEEKEEAKKREDGEAEVNDNTFGRWEKMLNPETGIPIKFDTKWLDIFWENRSGNYVDEIFFAFLNRFFWNELFIAKKGCTEEYVLKVGEGRLPDGTEIGAMENENPSYRHLNKDNCNEYASLTPYRYLDDEIPVQLFEDLQKVLDNYSKYKNSNPQWEIPCAKWIEGFYFIPRYAETFKQSDSPQVIGMTLLQRIKFFALCKYFREEDEKSEADYIALERWMRVVCNLISGVDENYSYQIRSIEAVRSAIEQMKEIGSHDIYRNLCDQQVGRANDFVRRWTEEIYKARQIINEDGSLRKYDGLSLKEDNTKYENWEDIIIDAENYAFFRGAIRFLFLDKSDVANWKSFDKKWANVRKYFKKEIPNAKESCLNEEYNNADLLKALISRFDVDDYEVIAESHKTFNNKASSWLYYLLNPEICDHIHNLLLDETTVVIQRDPSSDDFAKNTLYLLSNTGLLDYVIKEIPTSWIRWYPYHNHYAIYPSGEGIFLNAKSRDDFLLHADGIIIDKPDEIIIPETELLFGSDIYFDYSGKHFQWYRSDFIYLMKDDNPYDCLMKDESSEVETERKYCFYANDLSREEIKDEMDKLIREAKDAKGL